ncbi:Xylan alpha-(1-_2)-glucuronosidase [compost metagenome]
MLQSGKTVIQHIYDTHFEGVEQAGKLAELWAGLSGLIEEPLHRQVAERLAEQAEHAKEWRDQINTYFYRKSGIPDQQGRRMY